jgi:hypothetical protein
MYEKQGIWINKAGVRNLDENTEYTGYGDNHKLFLMRLAYSRYVGAIARPERL